MFLNKKGFVEAVGKLLVSPEGRANKLTMEKLAKTFGIEDRNVVKELIELAIVIEARKLAHEPGQSIAERYASIVELYKGQVNLSHRTSQSVMLQQYSTPAPIGYLMGIFCGIDSFNNTQKHRDYWVKHGRKWSPKAFEPSAGNGLLTIAGEPMDFIVNEIDPVRRSNLETQGFSSVSGQDATDVLFPLGKEWLYEAVLTNPPFGKLDRDVEISGYTIGVLDHLMAIRALDCMDSLGRAAIIIGGHTTWDEHGRVQAGKNRIFFNYLNHFYNVLDVILIDGHALYSRQGTSFDTRLILIDGRKEKPEGHAPLKSDSDVVVKTFDELFDRVMAFAPTTPQFKTQSTMKLILKAKAIKAK